MTTTDKTGEKLVASIRRTRGGAAESNGGTKTAKTPTRRQAVAKNSSPATSTTVKRMAERADHYQSSRRVWPD